MGHGKTGTIGGRSAERPTRSSTGNGRIVKEELLKGGVLSIGKVIEEIEPSSPHPKIL